MLYSANNTRLQLYIDRPTDVTPVGAYVLHLESLMGGQGYDLSLTGVEVMQYYFRIGCDIDPVPNEGEYRYTLLCGGDVVAEGLIAFGDFHSDRTCNATLTEGEVVKGGYGKKPNQYKRTNEIIQYGE